ncbi:hypothetical protein GCM10022419_099010 [Nonomuraea rosea]|uniref:Transposase DDE domain-containing protein n=1 Tax=Nonomuraea rosea TaxID=638574 RepID=A0ABP6Z6D9_9ACTN
MPPEPATGRPSVEGDGVDHKLRIPRRGLGRPRKHPGARAGRPPGFDAERYKERNAAERCINKMKGHRAVALRADKRERIHQGTVDVASIRIWLRDPVR